MKRFLSFLGTGNYQPCRYRSGERMSPEVVYVQTAINLFAAPRCEEAVVFCTAGAKEKHGDGLVAEFARNGLPAPRLVDIPDGSSEEQLWNIFRIVRGIVGDGDEIVFDVTHSFRSLPVVMTVLLRYLSVAKGISLGECLYGAWEARDKESNVAPIFDLTPFFALDDWTHAILGFEQSGDSTELRRLAVGRLGPRCRNDESARAMNAAVRKLALFADFVRVADLGAEGGRDGIRSMRFRSEIARPLSERGIAGQIPELESVLERLGEQFSDYGDADTRNGFRAARWAADHGLFPQAYTLLQETSVSLVLERFPESVPASRTGVSAREFVSAVITLASDPDFDWSRDWRYPGEADAARTLAEVLPPGFAAAFARVSRCRNALNHAGTNRQEPVSPTASEFTRDGFSALAAAIEDAIGNISLLS